MQDLINNGHKNDVLQVTQLSLTNAHDALHHGKRHHFKIIT